MSPILEEDGNLSRIQSPDISNQVSPEPRRRHRHFAEPNGHIPESNGDSGVNRIDVVQEDTIQIEGNLTTIGGPWYFWKGICVSKAHKPVTLSGNHTFTKV